MLHLTKRVPDRAAEALQLARSAWAQLPAADPRRAHGLVTATVALCAALAQQHKFELASAEMDQWLPAQLVDSPSEKEARDEGDCAASTSFKGMKGMKEKKLKQNDANNRLLVF